MQEIRRRSAVASPSPQFCLSMSTLPLPRKIGRAVGEGRQKSKRRLHSFCSDFGFDGFFLCLLLQPWSCGFNGRHWIKITLGWLVFLRIRVGVDDRQRGFVAFDVELMAVILHCRMKRSLARIAKTPILPISATRVGEKMARVSSRESLPIVPNTNGELKVTLKGYVLEDNVSARFIPPVFFSR